MNEPRVLMVGPGRNVMGGISTVVNNYYSLGLPDKIKLKYISSMEDGNKLKKLFIAIKAYMAFCNDIKNYDILHVHMAAQASFTRKAYFIKKAYSKGKKIVIHQHAADFDVFYFEQSDEKKKAEIRNVFAMAVKVIVLSDEWADFFGKNICDSSKIEVVYNGVIIPQYKKDDYSDHNVLFLGRLGERKGSYDLIEAIPLVLKAIPDAMFFLGGDGDVDKSKEIAESKGIADHVKFLGWIRDEVKENYLRKCSIFTLPSYHEGMPMSVLEAMSYGLAAVSTNAGGIPQIIGNGMNGIRIDAGDIDALAKNIVMLLSDTAQKAKIGNAGRKRIKSDFNAKNSIGKIINIYNFCE
jgi:glycosyltransferase involved in cell wall biosynthesis